MKTMVRINAPAIDDKIEQFKNGKTTYPLRSAKQSLESMGVEVDSEFNGFFEGAEL
jgi:hypothetical protein